MKNDYLLDGQPIDFVSLIKEAKRLGYEPDGVAFTSEAAAVLRKCGHTVEENKGTV